MNKREITHDEVFDELIKHAAARHLEKIADELPSEKEPAAKYTFSRRFEEKMQRLFARQRRLERHARIRRTVAKIAAVIIIFLAISAVTVWSVDAWRVNVLNFITEVGKKSTTIRFEGGETADSHFLHENRGIYLPTYIPDDYIPESIEKVGEVYFVVYVNDAGEIIELMRLSGSTTVGIDSENAYTEQFLVNDEHAQYYFKNETGTLLFKYNENAFLVSGLITKDELIRMAESVQYIK